MRYMALGRLAAYVAVAIVVAIGSLFRSADGPAQYVAVEAKTEAVRFSCRPRSTTREEAATSEENWEECDAPNAASNKAGFIRRAEIDVTFKSPVDERTYDDSAVMYVGDGFPAPPRPGDQVTIRMNTANPHDFSIG